MKVGIYISGLGQSFINESVEKYAERLKNEISFHTNGIQYEIKSEKISYAPDRFSTVVSICEKNKQNKLIYKFYDFKYHEILTEKFNNYSLIRKNLWLFLLVIRKFPIIIKRLFKSESYNHPFQTFYIFLIFIIIASAVLLMLPATFTVINSSYEKGTIGEMVTLLKSKTGIQDIPLISKMQIKNLSRIIVSVTALLLLIIPNANVLITNLATEFICANDYMQYGVQKQLLQGNLELLVDYISENEKNCKIHFHTYSFGSILALDYIYPYGNKVSANAEVYCEAIITIGTPFEFINSYYPQFYLNRTTSFGDTVLWLNIYSIADALATNFRNDSKIGDAQFGIERSSNKPVNINYEVVTLNKKSVVDFLMLYSVKVHGMYWDNKAEGLSCLGLLYKEMKNKSLI
ncbi:hypothetical protein [Polluticaenibacter yanchengensis]|uniref:Uncharacterized protein n=1 Tax=Polluticaenibacter yanchengensis TaxID=3014562 RepID=A0ABT4UFI2_9BACT|nr:hypothetical protein [Chitinophagaceae bacterium LY-5]